MPLLRFPLKALDWQDEGGTTWLAYNESELQTSQSYKSGREAAQQGGVHGNNRR
jgi:uncharacterized protein (DUF302 family)